jgi:hypothetical protein
VYIVNTLLGEREPRYSSVFERVRLDPRAHTLVWPNGADFDPAYFTTARGRWRARRASAELGGTGELNRRPRLPHDISLQPPAPNAAGTRAPSLSASLR